MKKEKWIKWEPIQGIPQTLYFKDLRYERDGLTLSLMDKDYQPIFNIHFNGFISCRIIDEGDLLRDSKEIDRSITEMAREEGSFYKWSLFTVEESFYLQWFQEQSLNICETTEIEHYIIRTPDDVIEVLSTETPKIMLC